ncbi:DUF1398 family protein [uncultured Bradyrhizobium sp.]|uniref:DUF1398 family protein n=1 Tax=uncultured Bradyrhizobium sp. TaxID=199684 RepID=UPI0035CC8B5D
MDDHVKAVVREMTAASEQERVGFPELVEALTGAGIERYHADLLAGTKTWYMPDGSFEITHGRALAAAKDFRGESVQQAVHAVRQGEIRYRAFCERIAAAGCVGYFVSLAGRRAVYYGRTLAAHVEWFAPPPSSLPPPPGPPPARRAA